MTYREIVVGDALTGVRKSIICEVNEGNFISFPADDENPYYQQYLAWLAEGNTPLPPDAPTEETK